MAVERKTRGKVLNEFGILTEEQLMVAVDEREYSGELDKILVNHGIWGKQQLTETFKLWSDIPQIQISKIQVDPEVIKILPPHLIRQHHVLPITSNNNNLTVAMSDPFNQRILDDLRMASGMDITPLLASESELVAAIQQYLAFSLDPVMERILEQLDQNARIDAPDQKEKNPFKINDEAPIIRFVDAILKQAVNAKASDIHIEPQAKQARVRFRVDGDLYQVLTFPLGFLAAVISRLKIMASMDIAEKRTSQDGRFWLEIDQREIDFRVSSLPINYGEKMVLRILDRAHALTGIEQLGLSPGNQKKLMKLAHRHYGLILVTGPTGSGKTTTLYSILREINMVNKNIITLEDPIEYSIEGVNQVQINPKAGLTFASGLRSILRQDPDVIMVGEIRDRETARLAVQAALTGHLVISTLHTNTAAGTIARLNEMGIENYLLANSLIGVVSQRLVRRICPNCREPFKLDEKTAVKLNLIEESYQEFFHPVGCSMCRQLGYQGRLALHELMLLGNRSREVISRGAISENSIQQIALQEGMKTIKTDGIGKAKKGLTSLEEVIMAISLG